MQIKAAIIDFDGTIVNNDILDLLCDLAGKKHESEKLNKLFHKGKVNGLTGLTQRINFLSGLSISQIHRTLEENTYLKPGAKELFTYLKEHNIVTIIASGNIVTVLNFYQNLLGADYVIGSKPIIKDGRIVSISEKDYPGLDFKIIESKTLLKKLNISEESIISIGDSPADIGIFKLAKISISIDPKSGIEEYTNYTIKNDLHHAIPILNNLLKN